jgi:hypothetical protein
MLAISLIAEGISVSQEGLFLGVMQNKEFVSLFWLLELEWQGELVCRMFS